MGRMAVGCLWLLLLVALLALHSQPAQLPALRHQAGQPPPSHCRYKFPRHSRGLQQDIRVTAPALPLLGWEPFSAPQQAPERPEAVPPVGSVRLRDIPSTEVQVAPSGGVRVNVTVPLRGQAAEGAPRAAGQASSEAGTIKLTDLGIAVTAGGRRLNERHIDGA